MADTCQPIVAVIRHSEKIDRPVYTLQPAGRAHAIAYVSLINQLTALISQQRQAQGNTPICPIRYVMVPTKKGHIDTYSHSYLTAKEMQDHGAPISINPTPNYAQLDRNDLRAQFYQVLQNHQGQSILVVINHTNTGMYALTHKLNKQTNIIEQNYSENNDTSSNFAAFHVFYPDANLDSSNNMNYQLYLQMFKLEVDGQIQCIYPTRWDNTPDQSDKGMHSLSYYITPNNPDSPGDTSDLGTPSILQTQVCASNDDQNHTINNNQCSNSG